MERAGPRVVSTSLRTCSLQPGAWLPVPLALSKLEPWVGAPGWPLYLQAWLGLAPSSGRSVQIVRPLEDVEVMEKEGASFSCEVSHDEVPGQWFREGIKLRPSDTVRIRQEGACGAGWLQVGWTRPQAAPFIPGLGAFVPRKDIHSHLPEGPGRRCRGDQICSRKCRIASPPPSER